MLALVDFSTSNHSNQWNSIEKSSSNTEGNAIRPLPCTRGVIKHGRDRNSFSSVYERGSQARKESQFVLFRIREWFSSTEGIVICELPCTRGVIKPGRNRNSSSSVFERGSQARKGSQTVLFRIREGLSSTEGITNRSLSYPRRTLNRGSTFLLSTVLGQRTVSLGILSQSYFHGTHHSNFVNRRVSISYLQKFESKFINSISSCRIIR